MKIIHEKDLLVRKIFAKARKAGWESGYRICTDHGTYRWKTGRAYCCEYWIRGVVLRHDFAQAYFGDALAPRFKTEGSSVYISMPKWQYELTRLVLSNDAVAFLAQYL